ncbi:MAG: molecular chaperone TorD family protein [Deltaproteobacteria bacterium]|nr:molecular chaperone TorD family protein [Deltaproteobacteria bacterium]
MTNREKEYFCALAASLLSPPDREMLEDLKQEGIRSFLEENIKEWGGDPQLLSEFSPGEIPQDFLPVLKREYARLFTDLQGEKISLVESTYKPWTGDSECALAFAGAKGLLMGDYALHMREMFRLLSLEVPEEFRSAPDHLALELEFLSLFYNSAPQEKIQVFIEDHLDWIPDLKERLCQVNPHPFYGNAVELINIFLRHEKKEGQDKSNGSQNIH